MYWTRNGDGATHNGGVDNGRRPRAFPLGRLRLGTARRSVSLSLECWLFGTLIGHAVEHHDAGGVLGRCGIGDLASVGTPWHQ